MFRSVDRISKDPDRPAIWLTGRQFPPFDLRNWSRVTLLLARRAGASGLAEAAQLAEMAGLWLETHPAPQGNWLRRLGPVTQALPARRDISRALWQAAAWPRSAAILVDSPPVQDAAATVVDFSTKAARMRRRGARRRDPEARQRIRQLGRKGKAGAPEEATEPPAESVPLLDDPVAPFDPAPLPDPSARPEPGIPSDLAAEPDPAAPSEPEPPAQPVTEDQEAPHSDLGVELVELAAIRAALDAGAAAVAAPPAPPAPPPAEAKDQKPAPRLFDTPSDTPAPPWHEPVAAPRPAPAPGLARRLAVRLASAAGRLLRSGLRALANRLRAPIGWACIRLLGAIAIALSLPWAAGRAFVLHLDHVDLAEYD